MTGVRACGRAGVRACGRAGVRACGRAGVRACGRACGRAGVRAGVWAGRRACGRAGRRAGGRADRRAGGQAGRRAGGQAGRRAGGQAGRRAGGQQDVHMLIFVKRFSNSSVILVEYPLAVDKGKHFVDISYTCTHARMLDRTTHTYTLTPYIIIKENGTSTKLVEPFTLKNETTQSYSTDDFGLPPDSMFKCSVGDGGVLL